jgi:hypothetical protein
MIVSPFISNPVVRDFLEHTSETHLVSRLESLQELPQETLQRCRSVRFLAPDLVDESDEEGQVGNDDVLDGLHAKLFVIDHGWDASIFSGSFNATVHDLKHNVEFMVELVGKKSQCGVDAFLRQEKGETNFADLLQAYDVNTPSVPADATEQKLDDLLQALKQALAAAGPRLVVTSAGETDLFDLNSGMGEGPTLARWKGRDTGMADYAASRAGPAVRQINLVSPAILWGADASHRLFDHREIWGGRAQFSICHEPSAPGRTGRPARSCCSFPYRKP